MYQRTLTFFAVVALAAVLGTGSAPAVSRDAAHSGHLVNVAMAKNLSFATDPAAYGGGDQGMDNLYTLSNYICTDGIAVNVAYQTLGDVGHTGHEGHSLQIGNVQDYGTTGTTVSSPSTQVPVTEGAFPVTLFTANDNTPGGGTPATNSTTGVWTGQTEKVHFVTPEKVGHEVVATLDRRDHGFILNEDDNPRTDDTINGDDQGEYGGWAGAFDDGANGMPPALGGTGGDGDYDPNTDGSSFDDIVRTDQQPPDGTSVDPNHPNDTPSFMYAPDPSIARVEDCAIEGNDAYSGTDVSYSSNPATNANGWYNASSTLPVVVTFAPHNIYYTATELTFNYKLDGGGWQTEGPYAATSNPTPTVSVSGDAAHTVQYYWSDDQGNGSQSNAESVAVNIDTTPPGNIAFTWPSGTSIVNGQQFDFGDTIPAATGCTASDALSGMGTCQVSQAYSGNAVPPGTYTMTATATDLAENQSQPLSLTYGVQQWRITGFNQPVAMGGTWNQIKAGATVPLKFNVYRTLAGTEITDPTKIASYGPTQVPCPTSAATTADTAVTSGASSLRYDTTSGQFIFNWQSPKGAGQCYHVSVTAGGSTITANFMTK